MVDETSNDPTVLSFPLTNTVPSDADWEVSLDRGTHPSSPAWAALDSSTTAIVLTTIDANGGSMWIWRIDGPFIKIFSTSVLSKLFILNL